MNSKMADLLKGMSIINCRARGHPKTILHPRTQPPLFCRVACWRFRWEVDERTLHFSIHGLGRWCIDSMVLGVAWQATVFLPDKFQPWDMLGFSCQPQWFIQGFVPKAIWRTSKPKAEQPHKMASSKHMEWLGCGKRVGASLLSLAWLVIHYRHTPNDRDQSQLFHINHMFTH